MSVFIDENTTVLIQGLTGFNARKDALSMKKNGTKIVAGVVPKKGGEFVEEWPIYDTVKQALDQHQIDLSLIYAPPKHAATAIIEAIEAKIKKIVCVTEGIPLHDLFIVKEKLCASDSILIGPTSPGVTSPGKAKVGFIPDRVSIPGDIGVVGKSGTLSYEVCYRLTKLGLGQSTIIGIGGDSIRGTTYKDAIIWFENDDETKTIVLVGEIGGNDEEEAAEFVRQHGTKRVIAFIAGRTAPEDTPMGHAGALVTNGKGSYAEKVRKLKECGIEVAATFKEFEDLLSNIKV